MELGPLLAVMNDQSAGQFDAWMELLSGPLFETAQQAIAIGCRRHSDWVGRLLADQALLLAMRIATNNADFFARAFRGIAMELGTLPGQAGSTSSKPSSSTDTAAAT